jgi:hypothetical protein
LRRQWPTPRVQRPTSATWWTPSTSSAVLSQLREQVAATEELNLDSKLRAAALPGPGAVAKLTRYETRNERELDRTLKRLEWMQERRRATGGNHPTT